MKTELDTLDKDGRTVGPVGLTATTHTTNSDIPALFISSMDIVCDYANNMTDYIYVELIYGMGTYADYIRPYANNLEVSISVNELGGRKTYRYKAIILKEVNDVTEETIAETYSTDNLDVSMMTQLRMQLVSREAEVFRIKDCSGVYADVSVGDVIVSELVNESRSILVDGRPIVTKLLMDKPDNDYIYPHLVIPNGVRAIALPEYIQNEYGIYNNGVGLYHTLRGNDRLLYIYSTYNTIDKPIRHNKLKIVNEPGTAMAAVDKSYYTSGDVVTIVVGKETVTTDDMGGMEMSDGSGIRIPVPQRIYGNAAPVEGDLMIDRSAANTEFYINRREDGVNYAKTTTDNVFKAVSNASFRTGKTVTVTWTYSNYLLVEPGQPVTYVSGGVSNRKTVDGTLVAAYTHIGNNHIPQTILTFFIPR